jgi:poly(3-hydroxybutyrate) depolymerase
MVLTSSAKSFSTFAHAEGNVLSALRATRSEARPPKVLVCADCRDVVNGPVGGGAACRVWSRKANAKPAVNEAPCLV